MAHLVFVHGFLGSSLNWSPIVSKLNLPLSIIGSSSQVVDLLWHSKRPGPRDPQEWSLETMAKDLISQITVDIETTLLIGVGHSFGLRPLLKASALHPKLFKALIIEDSSPQLSQQGFELLSRVFDEVPVPFENRETAKIFLEKKFGPESQMARFLMANLGKTEDSKQDWRFEKAPLQELLKRSFHEALWQEWENFTGPIHMILGQESHFVSEERLEKCLHLGSKVGRSFEKIPEAGHWVHADQPEAFCDSLLKKIEAWSI